MVDEIGNELDRDFSMHIHIQSSFKSIRRYNNCKQNKNQIYTSTCILCMHQHLNEGLFEDREAMIRENMIFFSPPDGYNQQILYFLL